MQDTTRFLIPATLLVLSLAALFFGSASPASAQAGSGALEIYFGQFALDEDYDDSTYGLRGSYRPTDRIGIEASLGHTDLDFDDITFLDLSTKVYLGSGKGKAQVFLFAGPGWAKRDFGNGDVFTANAGLGLDLHLGERVFLRPDLRYRWFDEDDVIDLELSLSLGFSFGR